MSNNFLLEVKDVTKIFRIGGIFFGSKLRAVDEANFALEKNKTKILALVGESGSGKTTLARMILGIVEPTKGQVLYRSSNIFKMNKAEKKKFEKEVQPIFQNPFESFNPLRKVDKYLIATAVNCEITKSKNEIHDIVVNALEAVGLSSDEVLGRYPHEFSGGQLQRAAIARALITNPQLLVADEPISMVDASLRMSILNIFLDLKEKYKMNIVYITHDLSTAYYISDDVAVIYRGSMLEYGDVKEVLTAPLHPYTKILLQSLPEPDPKKRWKEEIKLSGLEVKEFEALGCRFANRCSEAMDICFKKRPMDTTIEGRTVKCWLYEQDA